MFVEKHQMDLLRRYPGLMARTPFMAGAHVFAFPDSKTGGDFQPRDHSDHKRPFQPPWAVRRCVK